MKDLKELIRTIPDFPKPGILFRDVTTLMNDGPGFSQAMATLIDRYRNLRIDKVAGVEARGFILGGAIAHGLGAGFIPIRKKGKLPGDAVGEDYALEYGTDRIEMHVGSVHAGERVLVVDDLIATGGTAEAAIRLIRAAQGTVVEACFIIDLPELGGAKRLAAIGCESFSLLAFAGH